MTWSNAKLAIVALQLALWVASYCFSFSLRISIGQQRLIVGSDLGMLRFESDNLPSNRGQPWTLTTGKAGATRDGENWLSSLFDWTVDNYIGIPHWGFVGLCASMWLPNLIRRHRRRMRLLQGLCINCGYDLRETPNCCPECGAARDNLVAA